MSNLTHIMFDRLRGERRQHTSPLIVSASPSPWKHYLVVRGQVNGAAVPLATSLRGQEPCAGHAPVCCTSFESSRDDGLLPFARSPLDGRRLSSLDILIWVTSRSRCGRVRLWQDPWAESGRSCLHEYPSPRFYPVTFEPLAPRHSDYEGSGSYAFMYQLSNHERWKRRTVCSCLHELMPIKVRLALFQTTEFFGYLPVPT